MLPPSSLRLTFRQPPHLELHAVVTDHSHFFADVDRRIGFCAPILTTHKDPSRRSKLTAHFTDLTDQTFLAERRRGLLRAENQIADRKNKAPDGADRGKHNRSIDTEIGSWSVKEQERSEGQRHNSANPQYSEIGEKCLTDQQADTQQDEREASVIDGQHL